MEIVPLSAFRDNYIWALVEDGRCVVVDPGDAAPVQEFVASRGLTLTVILLTHRHADHIGGVATLLNHRTMPVYGPACEAMECVSHTVREGETIAIDGLGARFKVMAVPGHTSEHIAYLDEDVLFCGDTLFAGGCGRLLGGTADQLFQSLQRIAALPPQTAIYCAHEYTLGNLRFAREVEPANEKVIARLRSCESMRAAGRPTIPTRLQEELETNPFLRCAEPTVRAAVQAHCKRPCETPLEVFSELRSWKDVF